MKQEGQVSGHGTFTIEFCLTAVAMILAAGLVVIALISPPLYKSLIAEDGWVEYGSAILWLLGAMASAVVWHYTPRQSGRGAHGSLNLLLVLFFVACAGEEISWGQRIFHWNTPPLLERVNLQGEMNLHNIWKTSIFSNSFFILTTAVFVLLPRVQKRYRLKGLYRNLDSPAISSTATRIYAIALAAWIIVGMRYGTLGFSPLSVWGYYTQMDDELYEFLAAFAYFAFAVLGLYYSITLNDFVTASPKPEIG
jgi:hypothetical protein